ncbi:MAG: HEAT repeat domain-containing protein [Methanomicrobiales archaeon]|nr:HEAT repeat domain-containing protein [Methanomicrobiales archaeon]MDI6875454.1 HEAT repeat domain-containing protein [Methanomicrobiales archaeon]
MSAEAERPRRYQDVYTWIGRLRDRSHPDERLRAIEALESLNDPRAVAPLVEGLNDDDPEIRKRSAQALLRLQSVRAVDALVERLMDQNEHWMTRRLAAESLRRIRGARALEALAQFQPRQDPAGVPTGSGK